MLRCFSSKRGVSLVIAVFTLVILGIFAVVVVTMVASEQSTRTHHYLGEQAFYNAQTGLEYAIRQIRQGGFPNVVAKPLEKGNFTVIVDYQEGGNHLIKVVGEMGAAKKAYQISYNSFGVDCLSVSNDQVTMVGPDRNILKGMTLKKECNEAVTLDKIVVSWDPDNGEKLYSIKINNDVVWEDTNGLSSGSIFDVVNTTLAGPSAVQLKDMKFSSNMLDKNLAMQFIMTDNSKVTITFRILPPN